MKSIVSAIKLMVATCLALGSMGCSDPSPPSKPVVDNSRYYRMKVGLTYKGKPVDIDFVAGCGVRLGHDVSGGSIDEITGMTDLFRGVRMPEGHAVVVNSYPAFESPRFNPCDGDTTDHSSSQKLDTRVPKDWLPFIVWFERDDEFAHGIGYLTQDAYENKNARFGFRYARIERATKSEFEAFRKSGPANLLPPHQTDWMQGGPVNPTYREAKDVPESVRQIPASGWRKTWGRFCKGVIRTRPDEDLRAKLRDTWPRDHPEFWLDTDIGHRIPSQILQYFPNLYNQVPLTHFQSSGTRQRLPEVFPIASSQALFRLTPATSPIEEEDALIGDGVSNLGQVFCDDSGVSAIFQAVVSQPWKAGFVGRVDGIRLPWPSLFEMPIVFYRDQYVVTPIHAFRS